MNNIIINEKKFKLFLILFFIGCLLCVTLNTVSAINVNGTTFTDLNNTIQTNDNVSLKNDIICNLTEASKFKDGININKNLIINGNGYSINGNNCVRIFKITNSTIVLTLKNITLKNGNASFGGAIYSNNTLNLKCENNVTFENNFVTFHGGAITVTKGDIIITNTNGYILFKNNTADNGGAISTTNGDVNITSTNDIILCNNIANKNGGAIRGTKNVYITSINGNITLNNNKVKNIGTGGAIRANYNVNISSIKGYITLNNNKVNNGNGGAIYSNNGFVTITSVNTITLNNNTAINGSGGSIYSKNLVNLYNIKFINNNGIISSIYTKDIILKNAIFESESNNSPIYISGKAYFNNNTFKLTNQSIAPIIFNGTNITSHIIAIIYNNNTEYIKINTTTQINVTFFDDNNNIIAIVNNVLANVTLNNTNIGYLVNNGLNSNITYKANTNGTYLVNVKSNNLTNFTVKTAIIIVNNKNNPNINLTGVLNNTTSGGYIIVKLNETCTGNVTITINNTNYTKELINGVATIFISTLNVGNFNILVNYTGDNYFNPIIKNYTLNIPKVTEYNINVTGKLNNTCKNGILNITLPKDANGEIIILINTTTYNATVINGKAIINNVTNLIAGNNNLTINYKKDIKYNDTTKNITINIPKVTEYNINVTGKLNKNGTGGILNITLPKDANGNITVIIKNTTYNNIVYNSIVVNGLCIIQINEIVEGNNTITVKYFNDCKYNETTNNITFKVDPLSFTDLQEWINENTNINLETDYIYLKNKDKGSLIINKTITINGNGYCIDGKNIINIFNINKNGYLILKNVKLNNALNYCIVNNGILNINNVTSKSPIKNNGIITSNVKFYIFDSKITTYDSFIAILKTNNDIPIINNKLIFTDDQGHEYNSYIYNNGIYINYVPKGIIGYVTFSNSTVNGFTNLTSKGNLNITNYSKNKIIKTITNKITTKKVSINLIKKSTINSIPHKIFNNFKSTVLNLINKFHSL